MPYSFDNDAICPACPFGVCIEDMRATPVHGRNTQFRIRQNVSMQCTFGEFVPGTDNDPAPDRTFNEYLRQFSLNSARAGAIHFGTDFKTVQNAVSKVEGDVFELMEAAALWNALAVWNRFMETSKWESKVFVQPPDAVPTPTRRVAAVKLPRGYDTTRLFKDEVRREVQAFEASLARRQMQLGLSAPDIVGVRLPYPLPKELNPFLDPLSNMGAGRSSLEGMYEALEGKLEGRSFLFAIAVKRSTRSDRLYQPLFEANVLKFLIERVLMGAAFRFYVHMGSLEGAAVEKRYRAASLISLMRGGDPSKAVDATFKALKPAETAQSILNDLTLFPL